MASLLECRTCALKPRCCPNMLSRRIVRYLNEDARDLARRKMKTKAFFRSRNQRKKIEMRFAHLSSAIFEARGYLNAVILSCQPAWPTPRG
jgi:Transposase DDE domain